MRILLTGVTGVVGRAVARQLLAAGYAVSGIAGRPHENLDPDVDFVCGPLGGPILQQLADDSDVVVHLAPIEAGAPGSAGINGLVQVAHAAARAGARLIYASQVGRRAQAVPAGRGAGVVRLGAEPDRPDRAAGGPPAGLDDLPHDRQPAAQQGFDPAIAATAFR